MNFPVPPAPLMAETRIWKSARGCKITFDLGSDIAACRAGPNTTRTQLELEARRPCVLWAVSNIIFEGRSRSAYRGLPECTPTPFPSKPETLAAPAFLASRSQARALVVKTVRPPSRTAGREEHTMRRVRLATILSSLLFGICAGHAQTATWTFPPDSARCPSK